MYDKNDNGGGDSDVIPPCWRYTTLQQRNVVNLRAVRCYIRRLKYTIFFFPNFNALLVHKKDTSNDIDQFKDVTASHV